MKELLRKIEKKYNDKLVEIDKLNERNSKLKEDIHVYKQQINDKDNNIKELEERINKMKEAVEGLV